MCDHISPFDKFIRESAEQYLQTVVLVDDRIYESKSGSVSVTPHLTQPAPGRRKAALKSAASASEEKETAPLQIDVVENSEEVSFHEVQNSFAKKRIICSLCQPKRTASFGDRSDVYSLCSAADVVIVDWDIYGDTGVKATELVGTLIEQSMKEIPHQLRLVLIYTLDVNLGAVANEVYEKLKARIGDAAIALEEGSEGLVLETHNARVVVLGKRANASLAQYSGYFVPEKELAERTIAEFSRLASGLLQGIVLRGIAHLRENNRRILMRFYDLDAAFLAHRALLLPDEAFGQIIPLLTDEMRAVLEDTLGEHPLGTGPAIEEIINDWSATHWKPCNNPGLKIGVGADALEFAKDVFCNGAAIKRDYSGYKGSEIPVPMKKNGNDPPTWKEKLGLKVAEYLSTDSKGDACHAMLSSLMSQRIAYENTHRSLHLGVVVREMGGNRRYMLCLQPVCDSVRINGEKRAFIFCVLKLPEAGKPFTHAVMDVTRNSIQLDYRPKMSNCHVTQFTAGSNAVCAAKDGGGRFIYEDEGKNKYEWIAELKTEHAQRAAEEFGRVLSRVGLTESEWLRLKAK